MVCCCGSIKRPFGAAESIGTTRTMTSRGEMRSAIMRLEFSASEMSRAIFSFSSWIPSPVAALTLTSPAAPSGAVMSFPFPRSSLLSATTKGISFFRNIPQSSSSAGHSPRDESTTSTAASALSSTFIVRPTRIFPSSPSSSMPGVSIITHGPSGNISIAFLTGSVVVPATSETSDRF